MKQNVKPKSKRKKCKVGRGVKKGGSYERLKLKQLSLWWTDNKEPDIFQRTSGSGSKSTVTNSKRGALDLVQIGTPEYPIFPFIVDFKHYAYVDWYTIFTKNYKKDAVYSWIVKCRQESKRVGIDWLLIIRENRKPDLVVCESETFVRIFSVVDRCSMEKFIVAAYYPVNVSVFLDKVLFAINPKQICEIYYGKS